MKKLFPLLTTTLFALNGYAQDQHLIDSLETQLKNLKANKLELQIESPSLYDTTAANILEKLSRAYWSSSPDKAMNSANQSLTLSEQIGYKKGIANAYNMIGNLNKDLGNYMVALDFLKKSLNIRTEINDRNGMGGSYNNIANIYVSLGNYPEALKNHLFGLKLLEEIGDKKSLAGSYNNIGQIYAGIANYPEALKYYEKALTLNREIKNRQWEAFNLGNMGLVYYAQGNYSLALDKYEAALKIEEEIGEKDGGAHLNIGEACFKLGNYPKAAENYLISLQFFEEQKNKNGIALVNIGIGELFIQEKKFADAGQCLNRALAISKEIGNLESIKYSYEKYVKLDSAQGNFSMALEHYKLYIITRDSLVNSENTKKTVSLQMNYDFGKKQDSLNLVQASKDVVAQNEIQKQKLVRNGFVGGFVVVLLFAGVFFRQRNKTKKEKQRAEEERKQSEELLLNILPYEVATELKTTGTAKAKSFTMVTVMFTDFKDFTTVSEKVSAELLVDEIHTCFSAFDNILQKHKIEKIKTIGDAYLCASGLPVSNYTHASDMLNAAFEIRDYMLQRKKEKEARGEIPFELRIGIHTGPVVAGIVGVRKYAYDIWGDTVNLAARMEQNSEAGKVNISGNTYELVKERFNCTHRGKIQAKNKGEIDMYFVEQFHNMSNTSENKA